MILRNSHSLIPTDFFLFKPYFIFCSARATIKYMWLKNEQALTEFYLNGTSKNHRSNLNTTVMDESYQEAINLLVSGSEVSKEIKERAINIIPPLTLSILDEDLVRQMCLKSEDFTKYETFPPYRFQPLPWRFCQYLSRRSYTFDASYAIHRITSQAHLWLFY